jgi:hypothetical protein
LKITGTDAGTLPLRQSREGDQLGAALPQAQFLASAVRPGKVRIEALLYLESNFRKNLMGEVSVSGIYVRQTERRVHPRPVPQPDFVLEARTQWDENRANVAIRCYLKSFGEPTLMRHEASGSTHTLPHDWVKRVHGLLNSTLIGAGGCQVDDLQVRLRSLGRYLYQTALSPEVQHSLRQQGGANRTLLIIADEDAAVPWELLHDGRGFLGERFVVGNWFFEREDTRPYEFPIGKISVAHFSEVSTPELWAELLRPAGLDRLDALEPEVLTGGVLDIKYRETLQSLHVLRRMTPRLAGSSYAPVPVAAIDGSRGAEEEYRKAKLSLHRSRPLVTLGYLRAGQPTLTQLEDIWIPAYVGAGCSAFVGPRWAVQPAAEALFVSQFYTLLWKGEAVGQAFHLAQNLVRQALPESLDWLSYVLVADPMARAYRPVEGKGYAIVESVGRQMDDPLPLGGEALFRVSLRRTPPVWQEGRVIEVAEDMHYEELKAIIAAPGLKVAPGSSIELRVTFDRNYRGWFKLIVPQDAAEAATLVQVSLLDGRRPIQSLMFELPLDRNQCEQ